MLSRVNGGKNPHLFLTLLLYFTHKFDDCFDDCFCVLEDTFYQV